MQQIKVSCLCGVDAYNAGSGYHQHFLWGQLVINACQVHTHNTPRQLQHNTVMIYGVSNDVNSNSYLIFN